MTIVVWKILSMTPVNNVLPDKTLLNSIGVFKPEEHSHPNVRTYYQFE